MGQVGSYQRACLLNARKSVISILGHERHDAFDAASIHLRDYVDQRERRESAWGHMCLDHKSRQAAKRRAHEMRAPCVVGDGLGYLGEIVRERTEAIVSVCWPAAVSMPPQVERNHPPALPGKAGRRAGPGVPRLARAVGEQYRSARAAPPALAEQLNALGNGEANIFRDHGR